MSMFRCRSLSIRPRFASSWRLAGLGSASLAALSAVILAVSVVRANIRHDIVATARGDARLAVLPKMEATAPSDAQIAYVLARFVKNMRSLSADPVVVRANWIDALDHVTERGRGALNAHARDESPFARIGRQTITVEAIEVRRASANAFDIRWKEQTFENGAVVKSEHLMGVLSIAFKSPNGAGAIGRNPFGVYVDSFTWRRDPNVRAADEAAPS